MSTQASSPLRASQHGPSPCSASGSVICSTRTAHSLPAVEGERTVLLRSGAVTVRLRRSTRARRLRLVLLPGVGPELVVPARTQAKAIDGALATLAPWLERALARQQPAALGLAQPGVAWHAGEPVPLRIVTCQARERRLERRCTRGARARRRERRAGARALVPQRGARCGRRLDRAPGARGRRRAEGRRGARSAHALGLLLGARHALVLLAPAARAGLGAGRRRLPRALPPARGQSLPGVLAAVRDPPARGRLASVAARARGELAAYRPADSIGAQ